MQSCLLGKRTETSWLAITNPSDRQMDEAYQSISIMHHTSTLTRHRDFILVTHATSVCAEWLPTGWSLIFLLSSNQTIRCLFTHTYFVAKNMLMTCKYFLLCCSRVRVNKVRRQNDGTHFRTNGILVCSFL